MTRPRRSALGVAAALATITLVACGSSAPPKAVGRQAQVEQRGATVMPFDINRTTHVFRSTPTGGTQQVVAKSGDATHQVALVRSHLRKEARRFAAGDFSDPMAIHGMTMPGIDVLRAGFDHVDVTYTSIARGAQITYRTSDPHLVDALHQWFDAQLMDHGAHAHG